MNSWSEYYHHTTDDDFDPKIHMSPPSKCVIIGPSRSGKTTLMKRLFDCTRDQSSSHAVWSSHHPSTLHLSVDQVEIVKYLSEFISSRLSTIILKYAPCIALDVENGIKHLAREQECRAYKDRSERKSHRQQHFAALWMDGFDHVTNVAHTWSFRTLWNCDAGQFNTSLCLTMKKYRRYPRKRKHIDPDLVFILSGIGRRDLQKLFHSYGYGMFDTWKDFQSVFTDTLTRKHSCLVLDMRHQTKRIIIPKSIQ